MSSRNFAALLPKAQALAPPSTGYRSLGRRVTMPALLLTALLGLGSAEPASSAQAPSRAQVSAIVAVLRADPDLKDTQSTKVLRWKNAGLEEPNAKQVNPSWFARLLQWIRDAFGAVAEATRWLMWLLGALLLALAIVSIRHWISRRSQATAPAGLEPPARVGALDVRPQTLPARIGAEARVLWLRGDGRTALSLLYRGALSRLIHVHCVPIRAAHTEAECLQLAQGRLQTDATAFFSRLVGVWQLSVYGARDPDSAGVLSLCDDFDRVLDRSMRAVAER